MTASLDDHPSIRIEAAKGLSRLKSHTSLSMLLNLASPQSPANVRWFAIKSLTKRNSPLAVSVYTRGIMNPDWLIREASIEGLLALNDEEIKKRNIAQILSCLKDPMISVRLTTLEHLSIKDRRIYRAIALNVSQKKPTALIISSLKAINGYQLDQNTREKLIEMLSHPRTIIRILALRALKEDRKIRLLKSELSES